MTFVLSPILLSSKFLVQLQNMRAYWLFVTSVLIGCRHMINLATATDRVIGGQDAEAGLVSL